MTYTFKQNKSGIIYNNFDYHILYGIKHITDIIYYMLYKNKDIFVRDK